MTPTQLPLPPSLSQHGQQNNTQSQPVTNTIPGTPATAAGNGTDLTSALVAFAAHNNAKPLMFDYSQAVPVLNFNEILHYTQDMNLTSIPNLVLAVSFENLYLPLPLLTMNT